MQKVLRRTALAKRQAARREANRAAKDRSDDRKLRVQEQSLINTDFRTRIIAARNSRREDWFLGPLAPKRDVGDAKDTYGTIGTQGLRGVEKAKGEWKDWCIEEGDRVVIVEDGHRDRGKIGKVREVRARAEECTVEGLNLADVAIPDYMLTKESDKRPFRTYDCPIPLRSVRLVYPLPHPETGILRDVVIQELRKYKNPPKGSTDLRPRRYIAGLDPPTNVPYPEKEPEEFEDNDVDTLRIEVEERTWVPTLRQPPMPSSIIDELRNKYSKFRDRHDDSFIAKKLREEEEAAERKNSTKKMMTPLKELHRKERAEKKARGKPQLSEETLHKIGEVMARSMPSRSAEPTL
ncbi:MAG: hypothetical protein Q9187_005359 [Circinaria calcarea]